jgi:hypothetical protein
VDNLDDLAFSFTCDLNSSYPAGRFTLRMNAMYSIVAHPKTPASVPKFQVLLDKMLKIRADDKLRY